jgi:hypothetical protein
MTSRYSRGPAPERGFLASRAGLVLIAFLLIVGFLLTTEHRAHTLGALLWLAILACPLMHIFMHSGHQGHESEDESPAKGLKEMTHEH